MRVSARAYSWNSRKRGQNFGGMKCMFRFGFSRSVSSVVRLTLMCSGFLRGGVRSVFFNLFRLFLKPSEKFCITKIRDVIYNTKNQVSFTSGNMLKIKIIFCHA